MKKGALIGGFVVMATCWTTITAPTYTETSPVHWEPIVEQIPYEEPIQNVYIPYTGARMEPREFTYDEAQMLMRIAQAEAGNQGKEGMEQVMAVVLNRVASDEFPGSIEKVIFEPHQFQPVSDGRYYSVELSPEVHEALAYVESGYPLDTEIIGFEITSSNYLERYFTYAYTVGDHNFYIAKGEKK